MNKEIETTRLRLVPCELENLAEIHALWTNEAVRHFLFDGRTLTVGETRAFVEASRENFDREGYGIWLIFRRDNTPLIGFAGLLKTEVEFPNLLYGLHPEFCGSGLATEAAQAVLNYAFNELNFPIILADVDEANQASVRVLERLEMKFKKRVVRDGSPILYFEKEKPNN
jgi:ribosomal-protein-alanine N-acetyltransferase